MPGAHPPGAPGIVFIVEEEGCLYTLTRQPVVKGGVLSERECEIARHVALGLSNKQIAATLGISTNTVATYLRRMFRKLGVSTRAALVAAAVDPQR
jgi:DNA-binding CsgD family transcriptional regulator